MKATVKEASTQKFVPVTRFEEGKAVITKDGDICILVNDDNKDQRFDVIRILPTGEATDSRMWYGELAREFIGTITLTFE